MYDVLSLDDHHSNECLHVIYSSEFEIKDTAKSKRTCSNIICFRYFDIDGRLPTKIYSNRDDFHFPIDNFPSLSTNI